MNLNDKNVSTFIWAVSAISEILGEISSSTKDSVVWSNPAIPENEDGSVPYAAQLSIKNDCVTLWINDDLPQDRYYQLHGYASVHGIEVVS